eukprot:scaffold67085_cov46-Phaeocystis_antarctica.AAC.1
MSFRNELLPHYEAHCSTSVGEDGKEYITFKKKMEGRRRSRRRGRCAHPTLVHSMKPPLIPPGRQSSISSALRVPTLSLP